ncbi:MAG: TaqI-like C-terminal specificity domain-containing protein [Paludibacteraceae bacterium]
MVVKEYDDFSKQKIVWAELAKTGNAFTIDNNNFLVSNTVYILTMSKEISTMNHYECLLSVLNSKALLFYMDKISTRLDETGWRWLRQYVEILPIPTISIEKQNIIKILY